MAELADAQDLKSCGTYLPYRFDSGRRHLKSLDLSRLFFVRVAFRVVQFRKMHICGLALQKPFAAGPSSCPALAWQEDVPAGTDRNFLRFFLFVLLSFLEKVNISCIESVGRIDMLIQGRKAESL